MRQRGALLRQAGGKATPEIVATLDVWDTKLAEHGAALVQARRALATRLEPVTAKAYAAVAAGAAPIGLRYVPSWANPDDLGERDALHAALTAARGGRPAARRHHDRSAPRRVGITHRDAAGAHARVPGRTTLVGAWRCASRCTRRSPRQPGRRRCCCSTTCFPSSTRLDRPRCWPACPSGQAILTTAGPLPDGAVPASTVRIAARDHLRMTWRPLPQRNEDVDPARIGASLDKVAKRFGTTSASALQRPVRTLGGAGRRGYRGPREARLAAQRAAAGRSRLQRLGDAAAIHDDRSGRALLRGTRRRCRQADRATASPAAEAVPGTDKSHPSGKLTSLQFGALLSL